MLRKVFIIFLMAWMCGSIFTGCSPGKKSSDSSVIPGGAQGDGKLDYTREEEQQLLDDTFRIDIKTITALFDYYPSAEKPYAECGAVVVFTMRPGQSRAIVHFTPAVQDKASVGDIYLDGEFLDINSESDVRIVQLTPSSQKALEFQRDLAENRDHILTMAYNLNFPTRGYYPRFSSNVNDVLGNGNEAFFPTINSPHELARHFLTFRIQDEKQYRFLGSGLVRMRPPPFFNNWSLDTEQEVASYTVMFVLVPWGDSVGDLRTIDGVDVNIAAFIDGASIDKAYSKLETWLPELREKLGPFPMPRGLSIFLTESGGGMEYYGGTISSVNVLEHEVFHMYYGCSTINKTYRDSWLDEAIDMWYENSKLNSFRAISETYRSDIVCGRSPVDVGFDSRAYDQGARIIQAVAVELGGRDQMVDFLSYLYQEHNFAPFTTMDFLDYLEAYAGIDMRQRFLDWLYYKPENAADSSSARTTPYLQPVDMTPPQSILDKYRHRN